MAKSRKQKEENLEKLSQVMQKSKTVVFAGFDKLTVAEGTEIRKTMRDAGVKLLTVKKSLLSKALAGSSYGAGPKLPGQVALVYLSSSEDMLAPAREVFQAGKKHENKLVILGGIFDGSYVDEQRMISIASIPSREVLLAQFVNLVNSPIQRFVISLNEIAKSRNL